MDGSAQVTACIEVMQVALTARPYRLYCALQAAGCGARRSACCAQACGLESAFMVRPKHVVRRTASFNA